MRQMTQAVRPEERLYRIVEDGLCIGCGLCESIAGRDSVQVTTVENGYQRPVAAGTLDQETVDLIYDNCPGLRLESPPGHLIDDGTAIAPYYGPYRRMFSGFATDDAIRVPAASGGVLTALSRYLVESGRVAFGVANVADDPDTVANGMGSIYGPSPVLADIRTVLERGKPFAFFGKSYNISALRN